MPPSTDRAVAYLAQLDDASLQRKSVDRLCGASVKQRAETRRRAEDALYPAPQRVVKPAAELRRHVDAMTRQSLARRREERVRTEQEMYYRPAARHLAPERLDEHVRRVYTDPIEERRAAAAEQQRRRDTRLSPSRSRATSRQRQQQRPASAGRGAAAAPASARATSTAADRRRELGFRCANRLPDAKDQRLLLEYDGEDAEQVPQPREVPSEELYEYLGGLAVPRRRAAKHPAASHHNDDDASPRFSTFTRYRSSVSPSGHRL